MEKIKIKILFKYIFTNYSNDNFLFTKRINSPNIRL